MRTKRSLATILFTDIVGSTTRASELGDHAWRELLSRHNDCVRRELKRHLGLEVNTSGDGFVARFESPDYAIICARAIRDAVRELGIEIRGGLHMGQVEEKGDDFAGIAIHIGARVAAEAGPGEILVSRSVRDSVEGAGFSFEDAGVHGLKGIPGEWGLFRVIGVPKEAAPSWGQRLFHYGRQERSQKKFLWIGAIMLGIVAGAFLLGRPTAVERGAAWRLAVLPFENLGESAENARFTDGITAEVRGKLIALPGLLVTAPASSNEYRLTNKSWQEIGQELGVQYLLVGSVRWEESAGGEVRVRVTPGLVQVSTGALTWQEPFDATLTNMFEVQTRIAERVAEALDVTLSDSARKQLAEKSTQNLAAYDAFLRGEEISQGIATIEPASLRRAADYYAQAVALDSGFIQAWARLSVAHSTLYANSTPTSAEAEQALEAARRALAIAPNRPEGHAALGVYYYNVTDNFARALEELETARELAPNDAELLWTLSWVENSLGRWEAALAHLQQAQRLDPRSARTAQNLTFLLIWLRRYPEARRASEHALALSPVNLEAIQDRAIVSLAQGDLAGARAVLAAATKNVDPVELVAFCAYYLDLFWVLNDEQQRLLLSLPPSAFDGDRGTWGIVLAQTHALRGDQALARVYADSARAAFEEHLKDAPNDPQQHILLGLALAYLGRKGEAVQAGRRGVAIMPVAEAHLEGAYLQHQLARIYILVGEPEKSLDQLEPLLEMPYYLSPGWLQIDPTFDPLRNNPRFQKLVAGSA